MVVNSFCDKTLHIFIKKHIERTFFLKTDIRAEPVCSTETSGTALTPEHSDSSPRRMGSEQIQLAFSSPKVQFFFVLCFCTQNITKFWYKKSFFCFQGFNCLFFLWEPTVQEPIITTNSQSRFLDPNEQKMHNIRPYNSRTKLS